MKPKPFASLNHLTLPRAISLSTAKSARQSRLARATPCRRIPSVVLGSSILRLVDTMQQTQRDDPVPSAPRRRIQVLLHGPDGAVGRTASNESFPGNAGDAVRLHYILSMARFLVTGSNRGIGLELCR